MYIKMKLCFVLAIVNMIRVGSTTEIAVQVDDESLSEKAVNIVDECLSSSESWSTILIVFSMTSPGMSTMIHTKSKASSLVLSLETIQQLAVEVAEHASPGKCHNYLNDTFGTQELKPNAFIVTTESLQQLEAILNFTKHHIQRLWNPRWTLLVVLEGGCCNATECNNMFKVIWNYWILDAVIVCFENNPKSNNYGGLELYTFNPYSGDHPSDWELVIRESIRIPIQPESFDHPWHIFKRSFNDIKSSEDCDRVFFDKRLNLNEFLVPITIGDAALYAVGSISEIPRWYDRDWVVMRVLSKKMRCSFALVPYEHQATGEHARSNGSGAGAISDIARERLPPVPIAVPPNLHPSLGSSYYNSEGGVCFVSRIVGPRPQWSNIADAKATWMAFGVAILFLTVSFYLQNKSQGIVSALLDAERLVTGSSVIHTLETFEYRIVLASVLLVVLVVDGSIRGSFISTLTVLKYYPNFDTVDQLTQHNVKLYGDIYLEKALNDPELKVEYSPEYTISNCMEGIERDKRQLACLGSCRSLPYLTLNLSHVHIASGPPVSDFIWFVSSLHTSFMDRYYSESRRITEGGLVHKFEQDLHRDAGIGSWKLRRSEKSSNVKAIELNDVLPAYMLLCLGLSIALFTFIWEMRSTCYLPRISIQVTGHHRE